MNSSERYTVETIMVAVPCPCCGADSLVRTYIPALGSLNGDVVCKACNFEDSYVGSLASAMPADPLPSDLVSQPPQKSILDREVEQAKPRPGRLPPPVAEIAVFLVMLVGAI